MFGIDVEALVNQALNGPMRPLPTDLAPPLPATTAGAGLGGWWRRRLAVLPRAGQTRAEAPPLSLSTKLLCCSIGRTMNMAVDFGRAG